MALPAPTDTATVVVTGASSGIGEAFARELATRGHHVTLIARRRERLKAIAAELGHGATILPADLASRRARDRVIARLADGGRDIAGLVNNAGVGGFGAVVEQTPAHAEALVETNVNAVHTLAVALVGGMVERGAGAILNVASILGHGPIPHNASYSASKAFAITFSEALHAELAGTGVSCTALSPGPVRTDIFSVSNAEDYAGLGPGALWHEPDDVAHEGVDAMERGERHVIPGLANQLFAAGERYLPRRVLLPLQNLVGVDTVPALLRRLGF
jgi:short-subunit dehydrogenase